MRSEGAVQIDILIAVKNYIDKYKLHPTIMEIQQLTNIKSTSAVVHNLRKLQNLGFLKKEKTFSIYICLSKKGYEIAKAYEIIRNDRLYLQKSSK